MLVTPYHPLSNGLAERAVQTIKNGIRKMVQGNLQLKLFRVLINYRIIPQSTTGKLPAEFLMNQQMRSCLNLLQPNLAQNVEKKQMQQKSSTITTHKRDHLRRERKYMSKTTVGMDRNGSRVTLLLYEDQCQH